MNLFKVLLVFIGLTFIMCDSDEGNDAILSGKVVNAYTNELIANVRVIRIEKREETSTDNNGVFQFNLSENELESGDMEALRFEHSGYKPLETNASIGTQASYKMIPDTGTVYVYTQPVQLTDGIETADFESVNLDQQFIQDLMNKIYSNGYTEIHSVLVYRNDKLAFEEYFYGNNDTIKFENNVTVDKTPEHIQWARNEKHYVASVNKALTSTLLGIALDREGISINAKIANHLPNYSNYFDDPNKAAIEFEDCLNMTAGFEWDEWGSNDLQLMWKSTDFADFVLSRNNMGTDTEWRYNSALPNLLLKALENVTNQDVRTWANENFYAKLGIDDYKWQSQPDVYPEGAARMYLRPRDMIKIGATYLNNGKWNNEQIIPSAYVQDCFTVKENTGSGNYSNYFWHRELNGTAYLSADGDGGNYINIFPDQNMVIVITQGNYSKWPFYVNQANSIMKDYLIPAVQ